MDKQVEELAAVIRSDPKLSRGFNLVGHSQGGLLTRAYIQRFNDPPVHNYISLAGPHDGVYGIPDLNALCPDTACPWVNDIIDTVTHGCSTWPNSSDPGCTLSKVAQRALTFFSYWKTPLFYDAYLANSTFLADVNNEREQKNATYRKNMASLNAMLLV